MRDMLLGRDAEQRQLSLLLAQARAGNSGVLVLRGEPGIGKTALLDYAASRAGPMRILRATGIEAETELAFAGLYSVLHPLAGHLTALPERQAAALRAALGLGHDGTVPERLAVAAGTHGLLTTAAEDGALLLLIDDLHWLDPSSREAPMFAFRRLGRDAIACVMTQRADVPVPAGLPSCDLAGLGREQAEQLVEAIAGVRPVPAVAGRLHAETGGNPLALVELSAALTAEQLGGAEIPEVPLEPGAAIRQRFAARLDQLSPPAKTALLVAAAAGRCPVAEVTAAAGRLDGGDIGAIGDAEAAGLVHLTAEGVEFSHPLLRSVAYHTAAPAQRRAAQRALANALGGHDPERAAWQLAAAATGPDEAAAAALDVAAGLAVRKGAPLAAAAAWERAAELSEGAERRSMRLVKAAETALSGGDLDRVRRLTETVPDAGPLILRSRMLAVRGRLNVLTGRITVAQQLLQEAAHLAADDDPRLAVELLDESVSAALEAGLFDEARQAAELMAELAEHADETARFLADLADGGLAWQRGDPERGIRLIGGPCPGWRRTRSWPPAPSGNSTWPPPGATWGIPIGPGRARAGPWNWPAAKELSGASLTHSRGPPGWMEREAGGGRRWRTAARPSSWPSPPGRPTWPVTRWSPSRPLRLLRDVTRIASGTPARQTSAPVNSASASFSSWPGAARPCSNSAGATSKRRSPATTRCAG